MYEWSSDSKRDTLKRAVLTVEIIYSCSVSSQRCFIYGSVKMRVLSLMPKGKIKSESGKEEKFYLWH